MTGGAPMDDNKRTPDDSYKDLLDIYAREEDEQKRPELKNMVERNRKSGKKPFKLEIKDLDSEFTDAPQKRPPVRRDMPVHHSTDAPERHNAHKRPPEKPRQCRRKLPKHAAQMPKSQQGALKEKIVFVLPAS
jgi:hypothetical protein